MSKKEFKKYQDGEVLENNKVHDAYTSAVGFCFFNYADYMPNEAYRFASGIVSDEICCVFEAERTFLDTCEGTYSDPYTDSKQVDEYFTKHYSKKDFNLIAVYKCRERVWLRRELENLNKIY